MEPINSTLCSNATNSALMSFDCISYSLTVFHAVIMSIILAVVVLENGMLFALVVSNRKLHTTNILSNMGLVVADLLVTIVWVFQSISSLAAEKWPYGNFACSFFAYLYTTLLYIRWSEVFVLSVDRVLHIIFPFFYTRHSKALVMSFTLMAWLFPAVVTLPTPALGFSDFYLTLTACTLECRDNTACRNGIILIFGFFIVIGGLIPTILYFIIFFYGRNKRREMDRMLQMGSISGKNLAQSGQVKTIWKYISPQAKKALISCFIVFVVTLITNIPLYVTSSLRGQPDIYNKIPFLIHFIVVYIFFIGPLLDPLIIMRNKDIWEVIYKIRRKRKAKMFMGKATNALVLSILSPQFLITKSSDIKSDLPTEKYIMKINSESSDSGSPS